MTDLLHDAPPVAAVRPEMATALRALLAASEDPDTATACVIVDAHGDIRASGVNRAPAGVALPPARLERPAKYSWIAHAEQVAIAAAARDGVSLNGTTMVLTWFPCASCARLIALAGIATLVVDQAAYEARKDDPRYDFGVAMQLLLEAGVHLVWAEAPAAL